MTKQKKENQEKFIGTGRRKEAVASVFLYPKKGEFTLNGKEIEAYFDNEADKTAWMKPFHVIGVSHPSSTYSATVKVAGSGKSSQADAVVLAFSRAIVEMDEEHRLILRKHGLLTRDPRRVERKKPYLRKARKAPQYSKR